MSGSILDLFFDASFVVQFVIVILLLASIVSWMIIFERWIFMNKSKEEFARFESLFWSDLGLDSLLEEGKLKDHTPIGSECLFQSGYQEFKRLNDQSLDPEIIMEGVDRTMRISFSREQAELEKHLPFLATVASASPYIGLFGTVWGIMNSFRGLIDTSQATLSSVAPGISEALIATAIGLFAAIPALIAYNRFIASSDLLLSNYEEFKDEFSVILHREVHKG
tara:strand:- start:430 stop:1098 length:669 start_codon:yes stop_codon:yes gene_type:complete